MLVPYLAYYWKLNVEVHPKFRLICNGLHKVISQKAELSLQFLSISCKILQTVAKMHKAIYSFNVYIYMEYSALYLQIKGD